MFTIENGPDGLISVGADAKEVASVGPIHRRESHGWFLLAHGERHRIVEEKPD